MPNKELSTYRVQGESDKAKWYEVILYKEGSGFSPKCTCSNYIRRRKICQHIERALSCYAHGL